MGNLPLARLRWRGHVGIRERMSTPQRLLSIGILEERHGHGGIHH